MRLHYAIVLAAFAFVSAFLRADDAPLATNSDTYQKLLRRLEESENRIQQLEALLTPPKFDSAPKAVRLASLLEAAEPEVAEARWQSQQAKEKEEAKKATEPKKEAETRKADDSKKPDDAKKDEEKKSEAAKKLAEPPKEKKWYEKYSVRGYTQFRDNEVVWHRNGTAPANFTLDRSVGEAQNFFIRRARIIVQGDVSDHLGFYFQPDFAVTTPGSTDATLFTQLRDLYGDLYVDKEKVHRFRVGLSKVPYGWENMQSSGNRIPLERTDAINSGATGERDLGVIYYWTPESVQKFYRDVMDKNLKGTGNYGVFAFGVYNGQGAAVLEQNENVHMVTRLAWPIELPSCQLMELAVQAYTGKFTVLSSPIRALGAGPSFRPANTLETGNRAGIRDERVAGTFVLYPQPFGLQAEWNVGRGPALNDAQTAVEESSLTGGYLMALYKYDHCWGTTLPFVRYHHYRGGYKALRNAPYARIDEWEFGAEWQIMPSIELTASYLVTDRTNTSAFDQAGVTSYRQFEGHALRMQLQINY